MSRLIVRTLGLLAAALLTTSTPTFAAAPADDPSLYRSKKRVDTLAGLSRELQTSAVQAARSRSNATKLTAQGGTSQSGHSDAEFDAICGEWFVWWEEDADGDPMSGTFTLYCGGAEIPLP